MVNADESDPAAVEQVLTTIGDDVISALSRAAAEHNVIISLYISPSAEESNDDTGEA